MLYKFPKTTRIAFQDVTIRKPDSIMIHVYLGINANETEHDAMRWSTHICLISGESNETRDISYVYLSFIFVYFDTIIVET